MFRTKSPGASIKFLEAKFAVLGVGRFVSLAGRIYVMDRDNRWDRVKCAYDLIAKGEANVCAHSARLGLEAAYERGETDEFILPTAILNQEDQAVALDIEDSVVFMDFQADCAREISQALTSTTFNSFDRNREPHKGYFCTLTEYHQDFDYDMAFPSNCLEEYLSKLAMKQLGRAETEKCAHVTFLISSGIDTPFPGEERILVLSPKVRTDDLQPEMNAPEVTDHLADAIIGGKCDVIICNYANCNRVGYTGIIPAAILAVEAVDKSLQRIVDTLKSIGGQFLLTAGHGIIEQMVDKETGQPHTAHTTNQVLLVYGCEDKPLASGIGLSDLAPTMLAILGLEQPAEMTGRSLINAV